MPQVNEGATVLAWDAGRTRKAFAAVGFRCGPGASHVAAEALRTCCEAYLDKATDADAITLYELADEVIARRGDAGLVRVDARGADGLRRIGAAA